MVFFTMVTKAPFAPYLYNTGSGYVILKGKGVVLHTQSINLTVDTSTFQADLIEIQEAAKLLTVTKDTCGLCNKLFFRLTSSPAGFKIQHLKSPNSKGQT